METLTVSQINNYVKQLVTACPILNNITVCGEISNFVDHKKTGHYYFTLKDEKSSIKAVMFKFNTYNVKFEIENGMKVLITGNVGVFERDGVYQLYCETIEPDGVGGLYLAFEQLKEKLEKKGLFLEENKKSIPKLPKAIGVVTAKTGAALQDIINILSRRYPVGKVILYEALVQGENAPKSIVSAIKQANFDNKADVLIVGRGGGSIEDLWCFNSEDVANAIFESQIPVISAIGHEIDFTISDFVSDLRAPTPSAAAELVAPDIKDIKSTVTFLLERNKNQIITLINRNEEKINTLVNNLVKASPEEKIKLEYAFLLVKNKELNSAIEKIIVEKQNQFFNSVAKIEALSPLKVLTRGYSITLNKSKQIIKSVKETKKDDIIITKLSDGELESKII